MRPPGGRYLFPALAGFPVLAVILLFLKWQLAPPGPVTRALGDPGVQASHFFAVEKSPERAFRWSQDFSAVSLPALASSQVVSLTLDPARPVATNTVHVRLSVGDREVGVLTLLPGWKTYTVTVGTQLDPDVRLALDSDTFYPGAGDRRRLGVAVAEITARPAQGSTGLALPPFLWLVVGLLAPITGMLLARLFSARHLLVAGVVSSILPAAWALIFPADLSLPIFCWVLGAAACLLILRYAYFTLVPGGRLTTWLGHLAGTPWEIVAVGALTGLLAIVLTWPLVARVANSLPGWPADNFAFLYKLWWFRTAVLERHQSPLFDPNSYAPFGFNLGQGEPTLLNTLPGILLGGLFNDVVSYNLLALASFVISGIGAYLLVRELTGSRLAALPAAVAFAYCPYRMAQFAGHLQLLGTGWIALSFYFVERVLTTRKLRDGAYLGLCLALTALGAWYYAYMVGLAVGLYFLVRTLQRRRIVNLRSLARPLAGAAVVLLVIGGPAALPSLLIWGQGGLTHSAKAADEHSAAPQDYAIPNQLQPVWGEPWMSVHSEQNVIESSLYLGVAVVAVVVAGCLLRRRTRPRPSATGRVWAGLLVVTGVLSLGLTLHSFEGQVEFHFPWGDGPLPLPGALLFDWLPLYSSMRAYARFGVLVMLAAVVLMGLAWGWLLRNRRWLGFHAQWATLVLSALILFDFWTAPYAWGTSRVEPTQAARFLEAQPPGTIMQMPLQSSQWGPALYWETYYGKPIAYGYDTFEPEEWRAARLALGNFPSDRCLDLLRSWGVRYIVVSANAYGADWPGTFNFLQSLPRLRLLSSFNEKRTWDVDPEVLDARPDMEQYSAPDTLAVFELLR